MPYIQAWNPQKILPLKRRIGLSLLLVLITSVMVYFFLARRPKFEEHKFGLSLDEMVQQVKLHTNVSQENISIYYPDEERGYIQTVVQGNGWPNSFHEFNIQEVKQTDGILLIDYQLLENGYFSEKNIDISLYLPERLKDKVHFTP